MRPVAIIGPPLNTVVEENVVETIEEIDAGKIVE